MATVAQTTGSVTCQIKWSGELRNLLVEEDPCCVDVSEAMSGIAPERWPESGSRFDAWAAAVMEENRARRLIGAPLGTLGHGPGVWRRLFGESLITHRLLDHLSGDVS